MTLATLFLACAAETCPGAWELGCRSGTSAARAEAAEAAPLCDFFDENYYDDRDAVAVEWCDEPDTCTSFVEGYDHCYRLEWAAAFSDALDASACPDDTGD